MAKVPVTAEEAKRRRMQSERDQASIDRARMPAAGIQVPWYESQLVWGPIAIGIGIVLTVKAAMTKDVRWLLFLAWPCIAFGVWASLRPVQSQLRRLCVSGVVSASVAVALAWMYFDLRPPTASQLLISIGYNLKAETREASGGLWVVRKDYIAPVNYAVLVRITNASDVYVSVRSFSVSLRNTKTNKWSELVSMHAAGKLYCCTLNKSGLNQMHEIQLDSGGLFKILQNGGMPPRAQITNWLLLEFPNGFVPDEAVSEKLEFWDHVGRKYETTGVVRSVTADSAVLNTRNDVKDELDKLTIKAIYNPIVDLSTYRLSHIGDERP